MEKLRECIFCCKWFWKNRNWSHSRQKLKKFDEDFKERFWW